MTAMIRTAAVAAALAFALMAAAVIAATTTTANAAAADFTPVLGEAARLYAPVAEAAGGRLRIEIREDSPLNSASADRDLNGDYIVRVDRGLLRSPRLTDDVLRLILCHELGHLFGGPPRKPLPPEWDGPTAPDGGSLFSAEGQADVYAARACFRRIATAKASAAATALPPKDDALPFRVRAECDDGWRAGTESARLCRRAAMAALGFLTLDHDFPIGYDLRDATVVERTLAGEYPSRQCRLDSMLAAAARADGWNLDLQRSPEPTLADGRLPCWFRAR